MAQLIAAGKQKAMEEKEKQEKAATEKEKQEKALAEMEMAKQEKTRAWDAKMTLALKSKAADDAHARALAKTREEANNKDAMDNAFAKEARAIANAKEQGAKVDE